MPTDDDPDEPNLEERTIARLERRVLELEAENARLRLLLKPSASTSSPNVTQ